jgi:tryptophanyl-tRNA synthetase
MAADIILYDATLVPTGQDQKQHVEFARDIAQKFNASYGETFVLPDSYIQKEVSVVPGIDGRKMSKSYKNFIGMLDDEKTIGKKVKQIATDATPIEDPKDPDICNVFNIMKLLLTSEEESYRRKRYTDGGLSYKDVKDALFEKIIAFIMPIQEKYNNIYDAEIIAMLSKNADRANAIASKKITDIYKKV